MAGQAALMGSATLRPVPYSLSVSSEYGTNSESARLRKAIAQWPGKGSTKLLRKNTGLGIGGRHEGSIREILDVKAQAVAADRHAVAVGGLASSPLCIHPTINALHNNQLKNHSPFLRLRELKNHRLRLEPGVGDFSSIVIRAKKKGWFDDPFDYGEDAEDAEFGDLYSEGRQSAEEPRPPSDCRNENGFLDFPAGYMPEVASLGTLVRNDVRRCCCLVAGGVYDNLLFFPVIQLLRDRYPGVKLDILASARGKQAYELNKNVRRAWPMNVEYQFLSPVEFTELLGKIKGEYYDLLISTKLAGLGHSIFLWMCDTRRKVGYVYPNVNAAGSSKFLDIAIKPQQLELAESGFHMYAELMKELGQMGTNVPKSEVPPLRVGISKKVKEVVEVKCTEAGVKEGDFIVVHGIESDSSASMTSKGDPDSLLPLSVWSTLAESTSANVLFVIPNEKERWEVMEACGEDSHIVFITTPGQLAAVISASSGVVTTNTAALQLAVAIEKPTVALFSSQEKAKLYVPEYAKDCVVVASKTGKLSDLDTKAAIVAISTIANEALVAA